MTDEELAEYLPRKCIGNYSIHVSDVLYNFGDCFGCQILEHYGPESCYECALHWLKSEAEE